MSPETILEIVVSALGGGGIAGVVAIAFFKWLRDKDFSKHNQEMIELQSNADDKKQDNENLTRLIDSNEKIMTQLISAIGDSSKQHADTERTRREIAQSVTTAIDSNTSELHQLTKGLGMSTDNNNGHFQEMADKLEGISELLKTLNVSGIARSEQMTTIINDLEALTKKLESLESVPQTALVVDKQDVVVDKLDVATTSSDISIPNVQTPITGDNDKEENE